MTPKQKAAELVEKYDETLTYLESKSKAKQCALIAINEVLKYSKAHGFIGLTDEYEEIKNEIEKL